MLKHVLFNELFNGAFMVGSLLLWLQYLIATATWSHCCTAVGSGNVSSIVLQWMPVGHIFWVIHWGGVGVGDYKWVLDIQYDRFLRMQCVEEILKRGMVKDKSWTYGWVYDLEGKSESVHMKKREWTEQRHETNEMARMLDDGMWLIVCTKWLQWSMT